MVIGCRFAALMNLEGEIKVTSWLSPLPWSASVGLNRVSAGMLVFSGMYLIL